MKPENDPAVGTRPLPDPHWPVTRYSEMDSSVIKCGVVDCPEVIPFYVFEMLLAGGYLLPECQRHQGYFEIECLDCFDHMNKPIRHRLDS